MTQDTKPCPYCGELCDADFVDVGVGFIQSGPYFCMNCRASEIGPYDDPRDLSIEEKEKGWYGPAQPVGSSVNTFQGTPVTNELATELYRLGLLDKEPHERHNHQY